MEFLTNFWNNQPTKLCGNRCSNICIIRDLYIFTPDISI